MDTHLNSRQLALRYLLDEMSFDERAGVDDRLIADQEFSDSFQEAQYDLIDAYVANELPIDIRKRVERALLAGKSGESSLRLAVAIQQGREKDRRRGSALGLLPAARKGVPRVRRKFFWFAFPASVAACLLLALGFIRWRQSAVPQMARQLRGGASIAAGSPTVVKPSSVRPLAPAENSSREHPSFQQPMGILVVAMPMQTMRGANPVTIQLHPGMDRIEVQWPLHADAPSGSYTLEIASGRSSMAAVPQIGPLTTIGGIRVARFRVSADELAPGEFLFRLHVADGPNDTPIAETAVRVSR